MNLKRVVLTASFFLVTAFAFWGCQMQVHPENIEFSRSGRASADDVLNGANSARIRIIRAPGIEDRIVVDLARDGAPAGSYSFNLEHGRATLGADSFYRIVSRSTENPDLVMHGRYRFSFPAPSDGQPDSMLEGQLSLFNSAGPVAKLRFSETVR